MIAENLGIIGWKPIDKLVTSAIITGDPLLMLGTSGAAKTSYVMRLGQVFKMMIKKKQQKDVGVSIINAATANPDDWVGFNLPPKGDGDTMRMVKSPQTIVDSVVIAIDEISRAGTRNKNKVLSLIQEGMVDGIKTSQEILFAMMNPVTASKDMEDEGSEPLPFAMAERMALVVEPPDYPTFDIDKKKELVLKAYKPPRRENVFEGNKETFGKDEYIVPEKNAEAIWEYLTEIKKMYLSMCFDGDHEKMRNAVMDYVTNVSTTIVDRFFVSGRRASMMVRAILASHAVSIIDGDIDLSRDSERVLISSFMNKSMGRDFDPKPLIIAHQAHVTMLSKFDSTMMMIMNQPDKWKRLKMAINAGDLKPDEFVRIFNDVLEEHKHISERLPIVVALFDDISGKLHRHEMAKVGADVFGMISEFVWSKSVIILNRSNVDKMADFIRRARRLEKTKHGRRVLAIASYVANQMQTDLSDSLGSVQSMYEKALKVIEEKL